VISRFLLVRIGMDSILAGRTIHQKRQALDRIANGHGLQDAYKMTLDRIRQQDGVKSKLGVAVLMWVSHCERPLRSQELCYALEIQQRTGEFNTDNVPSIRTALGCTLGLVTVDEDTSTVHLLHHTLQKYLGESPHIFETQSMMAEVCLTYLNSPSVREHQSDAGESLAALPFLEYSTRFWGTHAARGMTEQVKSRALQLLDGYENHVSAAVFWRERMREWFFEGDVYGISGLHCIAFWGIAEIAIAMLERGKWDVNGRDSRGDTPLMWAVRYGNDRVVELLLDQRDIRPDVVIRDGRTVFSFAVEFGGEGAVKLLLNHGNVNPNSLDGSGRSPLSYAATGRHGGVLRLLVESRDIDPNSPDSNGLTPLSYAAKWGRKDLVQLFLDHTGANPNLSDGSGQTPLSFAASGGHEGVVELLLERRDVNPDSSDNHGQTPLSFAASGGHEAVVKLLLGRRDVNINSSDGNGLTPLSYAAISGAPGVVKLLLESDGVNPNSPDSSGRTPLSFAASGGHEGVVKVLLGRGETNPNSTDDNCLTPLSYAAIFGAPGVVKLLLKSHDVNANSRDSSGRTPLSYAAFRGHEGVVKVLLGCEDVNPNSRDFNGQTPLSYATIMRREGVVKLLSDPRNSNSKSLETLDQAYQCIALLVIISAFGAILGFPSPPPTSLPLVLSVLLFFYYASL